MIEGITGVISGVPLHPSTLGISAPDSNGPKIGSTATRSHSHTTGFPIQESALSPLRYPIEHAETPAMVSVETKPCLDQLPCETYGV